ncbi:MAG: nucleotidyl transferase AbiEii/AbiGii toxin family protein [bacterium]
MKLLEVSRKLRVNHQSMLIRFFHERLLYRVSFSPYKDKLWLKGGNLLYLLQGNKARPTVDIDFSGQELSNEIDIIRNIFTEILIKDCKDQVIFDVENMQLTPITEHNQYSGIRIKLTAGLSNIREIIQLDIAYGDVVTPAPVSLSYPVILDEFNAPVVQAYTIETVIAEKLQAILVLAQLNSRMKDFYDIYTLMNTQTIHLEVLKEAIIKTFNRRNTPLYFESVVFSEEFYYDNNRNKMWSAYLKKINAEYISFEVVVKRINQLVKKVFSNKNSLL